LYLIFHKEIVFLFHKKDFDMSDTSFAVEGTAMRYEDGEQVSWQSIWQQQRTVFVLFRRFG
jgi:hypothetical protein